MRMDDFAEALQERDKEQKASVARIARQAAVSAAASLCQVASEPSKTDIKVLLEVLKACGAFEEKAEDAGQALAQIIRLAAAGEETSSDAQD